MKLIALLVAMLALAGFAAGAAQADYNNGVKFLRAHQRSDGGFAESGRASDGSLSGWAVLGIRAARKWPARSDDAGDYLASRKDASVTDLELRIVALASMNRLVGTLATRLAGYTRSNGRIGPTVNSTIWGVIALRAAGRKVPAKTIRYVKARQAKSGGWSWYANGQADSNDTAAAIQALRAAGVSRGARTITRGLAFLRRLQNRDGGFELTPNRGSDAPSTAWAIQAFVAAGKKPGNPAVRYLQRLQRPNGSYRYNRQYATSPVWTTAQVVAALARRPFPLR
jgi:hypothetical protein